MMCAESSREIPNAPDDDTPLVFNERSLVFGINVCPLFQEVDESMEHHSGCLLQLKVATPTESTDTEILRRRYVLLVFVLVLQTVTELTAVLELRVFAKTTTFEHLVADALQFLLFRLIHVDLAGIEPATSSLQSWHSPS